MQFLQDDRLYRHYHSRKFHQGIHAIVYLECISTELLVYVTW